MSSRILDPDGETDRGDAREHASSTAHAGRSAKHREPLIAGYPLPPQLAQRRAEALARTTPGSGLDAEGAGPEAREASEVDPDHAALLAWLDDLPEVVEQVRREWDLEVGPPFHPGGSCSWVAPVRRADGADLVLKVTWAHDEARDEVPGLLVWQDRGAVQVERSARQGSTGVLLLEHCRPGAMLRDALPEPEQDEVLARLLRDLWFLPANADAFRPLTLMCDQWAEQAQSRWERASSAAHLPRPLLEAGLGLMRALPRDRVPPVLLATDLHPMNVLLAEHGTPHTGSAWRVIDPKPYLGDPHYDITQHLLNFPRRLATDPVGFVERMAGLCGLDRDRALAWSFARCVQEAGSMDGAMAAAPILAAELGLGDGTTARSTTG